MKLSNVNTLSCWLFRMIVGLLLVTLGLPFVVAYQLMISTARCIRVIALVMVTGYFTVIDDCVDNIRKEWRK